MKKRVDCNYCHRFLGWRKGLVYDVKDGTIQQGQGRKKPYLNFCNRTCGMLYKRIWIRLNKAEERIKKLEKNGFT